MPKVKKKPTHRIVLDDIKDPDGWGDLIEALELSESDMEHHFECREYASLELEIDEDLNVVGGRILPRK